MIRSVLKKMKNTYTAAFMLLIYIVLLTACGKDEKAVITELGVDGYVYVPEELSWDVSPSEEGIDITVSSETINMFRNVSNLKVCGDYLYFSALSYIRRLPLDGEADFTKAETVTEQITELCDYEIDSEQGICYFVRYSTDPFSGEEAREGGILYRRSADGKRIYQTSTDRGFGTVKDNACLAIDAQDRVYLLLEDGIHVIDPGGSQIDLISTKDCKAGQTYTDESLFCDGVGNVYYILKNLVSCKIYALDQKENVLSSDVPWLSEVPSFAAISRMSDGNILLSDDESGYLYLYDRKNAETRKLLRWQDSSLFSRNISELAGLSQDRLLVKDDFVFEDIQMLLLTRTSVDSLPPKEVIVVGALYPPESLERFVAEFNKNSDRYHVIIERYGVRGGAISVDEALLNPLDATLVSSRPPDLLCLDRLDVRKYAQSGALKDLGPYLDRSEVLSREDFLGNVIEGYTMEGSLVCIPARLGYAMLIGRTSQLSALESWGMEDMMEFTESYPGARLFNGGPYTAVRYNSGIYDDADRGWLLEEVCAPYYLERFIDEENWECNFDSEEFCRLLEWIRDCPLENDPDYVYSIFGDDYNKPLGEEYLFYSENTFNSFSFLGKWYDNMMGEEASVLGYPTVDGRGTFGVSAWDVLGIVSNAANPEGAWAFIEAFLTTEMPALSQGYYIPTIKEKLYERVELDCQPIWTNNYWSDPELVYDPEVRGELVDAVLEGIRTADVSPRGYENDVIGIIVEEVQSYFAGQKTVEDVASVIQNRVSILLAERAK